MNMPYAPNKDWGIFYWKKEERLNRPPKAVGIQQVLKSTELRGGFTRPFFVFAYQGSNMRQKIGGKRWWAHGFV